MGLGVRRVVAASNSSDQGGLKKIKGIGPRVEAQLKEAGITTPGQLARTPVNEIEAALKSLRGGYDADRITREGWLPQAATLAAAATDATRAAEPAERVTHNFTIEVQLAVASREIISSKVVHIQTRDEATWGGWDGQRVIAFIEDRSGAQRSVPAALPAGEAPPATQPAPGPVRVVPARETGLALHTFAMVPASEPEVNAGGSITVAFSFDTATIALLEDQPCRAKIDIYARQPPLGKSFLVGGAVADIDPGGPVGIQIPCDMPPNGYPVVLFAAVQLFTTTGTGRKPSSALPDARLTVSRTAAAVPGNPGAAA
jgi:hypothetical protein